MRLFCLSLLCVSAALASDPATLHVDVVDGRALSFRLSNNYRASVTKFQVAATNSGGSLGCSITAEVKRPEDLHPPGTCGFVTNTRAGAVMDTNWKARIVYVEFDDGMRWVPRQ